MNKILLNDNIDYTEHQAENQRQEVLKSQQSAEKEPHSVRRADCAGNESAQNGLMRH